MPSSLSYSTGAAALCRHRSCYCVAGCYEFLALLLRFLSFFVLHQR
ncbi:hypothetical protein BVRB_5g112340 [Beta vulgaris subsp. vulgaris]|nr:hypothetical protein BVRB_5g112340 [Beta vulgaris subsp. vulgaris]